METIINRITELAVHVRRLEEEARRALYDRGDEARYRGLMRDKALSLLEFPDIIEAELTRLPAARAAAIRHQVGAFAYGAEKALRIDSVFYMAALLYPEDYREGEDNDLEVFLHCLQRQKAA